MDLLWLESLLYMELNDFVLIRSTVVTLAGQSRSQSDEREPSWAWLCFAALLAKHVLYTMTILSRLNDIDNNIVSFFDDYDNHLLIVAGGAE